MTDNQIQTIEELALNALPCLQQILDDGWVLRFAEGYTKRANSVTPLYPSTEDLTVKIKRCQAIYHNFNLKSIFRLTDESRLKTLDRTLAGLGYQKQDTVSVRTKVIEDSIGEQNSVITIDNEISEEWLDRYVHAVDLPIQHWNTLSTMLDIVPHPTCYAMLKDRSRFCSIGLGVLAKDYLGLFFIATVKQQQNKGYGKQLISAMTDWGKSNGATKVYVQVEIKNQPAN